MKKLLLVFAVVIVFSLLNSEIYRPYIMGAVSELPLNETLERLRTSILDNDLEIVGEYSPANDENRYVVIVTNEKILKAISKKGGLRGFAAAWRIGLTIEEGKIFISYMNPWYFGNAYFQEDIEDVSYEIALIKENLRKSMLVFPDNPFEEFGSKKGKDSKKLKKYHYKIAMPYFDDVVDINEFESNEEAIAKIEENFSLVQNVEKIYQIDIPDSDLVLYGFGFSGEKGEALFLPKIDINEPKHTAFLPYEFLVYDGKVVMLHGRYRIALSFPDLSMGTFMKIMSTPGNLADAVESLTK